MFPFPTKPFKKPDPIVPAKPFVVPKTIEPLTLEFEGSFYESMIHFFGTDQNIDSVFGPMAAINIRNKMFPLSDETVAKLIEITEGKSTAEFWFSRDAFKCNPQPPIFGTERPE